MNTTQESYAEKIQKLLRKAESTTPEEAEMLTAKAQELMEKYAISELMLQQAAKKGVDEIVREEFVLSGSYRVALGQSTFHILSNCRLRASYTENLPRVVDGKTRKQTYIIFSHGYQSDQRRARLLDTSIQVQAARALGTWWKNNQQYYVGQDRQGFLARRQFLFSFADGLYYKLREATRVGREQAEKEEAMRRQVAETKVKDEVALVLKSRSDLINAWMEQHHPTRAARNRPQKGGDYAASTAGFAAGQNADVGQPGLNR